MMKCRADSSTICLIHLIVIAFFLLRLKLRFHTHTHSRARRTHIRKEKSVFRLVAEEEEKGGRGALRKGSEEARKYFLHLRVFPFFFHYVWGEMP
jgi:hypothetical protein